MDMTVRVSTPQGVLTFTCTPHYAASEEKQLIESEFYKKNSVSHTVPQGDHYELELVTPVWETITDSRNHVHLSEKTGKRFVCVTERMSSLEDARKIFEVWSLAIAHTMVVDQDLFPFLNAGDMDSFWGHLEVNGIQLEE